MSHKYIILVGDGMADYELAELGGKTPLEAARTPNCDRLAGLGHIGLVRTIPEGMEPGSDIANMSLMGYDPMIYHTGRAPLEAASMGVHLESHEVAFRCNLVCLEEDPQGVILMKDYAAGHITTAEAHELVAALQESLAELPLRLYPGVSYRHLLVWTDGRADLDTTPPHDISGQPATPHLEVYRTAPVLQEFIDRAKAVLDGHPVNRRRLDAGKSPANAVWLWGQGKAPSMPTLKERFGIDGGAVISAVDLLKGIGVYAGLEPVAVAGATGYLDTNYAGKVQATLEALQSGDLVYLHVEAPDEAGHEGSLSKKMEAIEAFDEHVVGPVLEGAQKLGPVRLLLATDHPTPIARRTHVADPVPFVLVDDAGQWAQGADRSVSYCERTSRASGRLVDSGDTLFRMLVGQSV